MKLNRRQTLTALGGALALPYVRPSWAQAGTVNVYNWADYIGETTIADFEAATGIGVVYDTYSSAEEMEAKMLAGSTGYDVCFTAGVAQPQHDRGWRISTSLTGQSCQAGATLTPRLSASSSAWDPGAAHMVPYMWGSVGIDLQRRHGQGTPARCRPAKPST